MKPKNTWFIISILCFGLVFFCLQFTYIHHLPLVMDEYVSAYKSFKIYRSMPYSEYTPYKNLLGYTLHGAILHFADTHWSGLMLVKTYLIILNSLMIITGSLLLRKHFRPEAILVSVALLVAMSTFLERSLELRVDMESAWMGFLSFIMILRKRWGWAGILAGVSFLITQKGIYYSIAGEITILFVWYFYSRDRQTFTHVIRYNAGILLIIISYAVIWSLISDLPLQVVKSMLFLHGKKVLFFNPYGSMHLTFWGQSIRRNPFFYFIVFFSLWRLSYYLRQEPKDELLQTAVPYCAAVILFCFLHTKPWPYFMVMMFPTAFILNTIYIDREIEIVKKNKKIFALIIVIFILLGIAWPMKRLEKVIKRDLSYQKATIVLAEWLLNEGETYLGGVPYLYKYDQVHAGLESLSGLRIIPIKESNSETLEIYINAMREARMKFFVNSYRTDALPYLIKQYLRDNYIQLWGNIDIYAPRIESDTKTFKIKFAGRYKLCSKQSVTIDGQKYSPDEYVELSMGLHTVKGKSNEPFRLKLLPRGIERHADLRKIDRAALFPDVYTY